LVQLTRHQIGALLLGSLRGQGLGVRDLFEGRQEPLTWFFRGLAFDQSELDIMESGAVEALHAPSTLVELMVDEMALACANIGPEGVLTYLAVLPDEASDELTSLDPAGVGLDPAVILGYLNLDVAPPSLWLEERESSPSANESLAIKLATMAQELGDASDSVGVRMEGMLDPGTDWGESAAEVRPAGVSVHFTFDVPLVGTGERDLAEIFDVGARIAGEAMERMRIVFRGS
jgi:hypothetical protein